MQDDSTNDGMETLIRYMDGELSGAEQEAAEKLLQTDPVLLERYHQFLAAKKAVRSQGIRQRVQAIHQEYTQEANGEKNNNAKIIKPTSFFTKIMSVAAVLLLVIAGYSVFQYTSTTNQSVYNAAFMAYQLPVNRSNETSDNIDALYKAGNYSAVINACNATQQKNQKNYFLAAQSYLQTNDANAAIAGFQQVIKMNDASTEKYFVQETDYYLMLAYIKAGKIDEAEKQLDKITANKQHLFYNKASNISRTRLMMLKWKK